MELKGSLYYVLAEKMLVVFSGKRVRQLHLIRKEYTTRDLAFKTHYSDKHLKVI